MVKFKRGHKSIFERGINELDIYNDACSLIDDFGEVIVQNDFDEVFDKSCKRDLFFDDMVVMNESLVWRRK